MKKIMKHKIGDIVQIKSRKWYNENKEKDGVVRLKEQPFARSMSEYLGKTAKIMEIKTSKLWYGLDIDEQWWNWTDDMFEDEIIPKEIKNSEPKKEIDWEQRRWELIKIFLLSAEKSGIEFFTDNLKLDWAIERADEFIKLLKK
jgi:hypothetical protein